MVFLLVSLMDVLSLPIIGIAGLASWVLLVVFAIATSRFAISVNNTDEVRTNRSSIAHAFVFLAVMLYAIPPSDVVGPAVLLAAIVAFSSSYGFTSVPETVFATAISVVSTYLTASFYGFLVNLFANQADLFANRALPVNFFLVPLFTLEALSYFLTAVGTSCFLSIDEGNLVFLPRHETIVWTLTTELAGAAAAVLFYAAGQNQSFSYVLLGVLIMGLVHLMYRFNEKSLTDIKQAEAERRRHIEEMATIHMNTIESLAIAIDAKDQTTHGHVRRTQIYATEMGKLFTVPDSELQALVAGALLHDIGKLAVPEYILNKPGKLTEAEFAKMKIHPTVGGDILRRVNFPYPVEDIVRYHHEKWDGSGYPKGLRGEAIPLVARIISVVDFYDATRCDRPYRKGMPREESLTMLRSMSGSAFDPRVVEKFIAHVEEFDRLIRSEEHT